MFDVKNNKVLILSLGAGKYDKEKKEMIKSGNLSAENAEKLEERVRSAFWNKDDKTRNDVYSCTTYSITDPNEKEGIKIFEKTPFVAEPLIKTVDPDQIVVIGSIRSAWSSFYLGLAARPDICSYRELFNIENGNVYTIKDGKLSYDAEIFSNSSECVILTGDKELDRYEKRINDIFKHSGGIKIGEQEPKTSIHFILIRYGVDEKQQSENYGRFKKINESLIKDAINRISFDISHSFRSIPFYNLVLLNYIETIEDYDIRIDHVFNGCFEAKEESQKIWPQMKEGQAAPILDLHEVIDLLELTGAIREFINTGNAVALTSSENSDEDEFLKCLKQFDWATQINDFGKIEEAVGELAKYETIVFDHSEASIINDRSRMILTIIRRKMLKEKKLSDFKDLSAAEKRLVVAEWYQEQNRYGQAIATGIEAMRSLVVPYYYELKHKERGEESELRLFGEKENQRRDAETRLCSLGNYLKNNSAETYNDGSLEKAIIDVVNLFYPARIIRNAFAHNLITETKNDPALNNSSEDNSKAIIEGYLNSLRKLYERTEQNKDAFRALYSLDMINRESQKDNNSKISGAVIIIDFLDRELNADIWENQLFQFKRNPKYRVSDEAFKQAGRNLMYAKAAANCLSKYFKEINTTIILQVLSLKYVSCLVPMLKAYSFKSVIAVVDSDKSIVSLPKGFYDDWYLKDIMTVFVDEECQKKFVTFELQKNCFISERIRVIERDS